MVQIRVEAVSELRAIVADNHQSVASRSLATRRFINEYKPSGPAVDHVSAAEPGWSRVDTDYMLGISSDMALLSNYLLERVVAAS